MFEDLRDADLGIILLNYHKIQNNYVHWEKFFWYFMTVVISNYIVLLIMVIISIISNNYIYNIIYKYNYLIK